MSDSNNDDVDDGLEIMYEHAARTFAYQQKAWFGRESKVYYDAEQKYWICEVLT